VTAVLRCWCDRHGGDVTYLRPEDYLAAHPTQEVVPLPTKKAAPKPKPRPRLRLAEQDGVLAAVYPRHQYRFLFDDGSTLDVVAYRDDSDLREAMLEAAGNDVERIAGVATVLDGMTAP
jgi:hypothetical protein